LLARACRAPAFAASRTDDRATGYVRDPGLASWSQDTDLGVIESGGHVIDRLAKRIEDSVLPPTPRHGETDLENAAPADN
jgi:hypothetical protein